VGSNCGHRDVPGKPALYATTKQFLDYFNLKNLEHLPALSEIKDFAELDPALELALAADPVPPSVAANDESSVEKDALFQLSEQEDGVNSNDSSMIEEYSETDMGDHQDSAAADE
jgi:segregation and condensation protein B